MRAEAEPEAAARPMEVPGPTAALSLPAGLTEAGVPPGPTEAAAVAPLPQAGVPPELIEAVAVAPLPEAGVPAERASEPAPARPAAAARRAGVPGARALYAAAVPVGGLLTAAVIFGLFMLAVGRNPLDVYALIWRGGFGSSFAWQNTFSRAAPVILTALAVAIPARMGLI